MAGLIKKAILAKETCVIRLVYLANLNCGTIAIERINFGLSEVSALVYIYLSIGKKDPNSRLTATTGF